MEVGTHAEYLCLGGQRDKRLEGLLWLLSIDRYTEQADSGSVFTASGASYRLNSSERSC
jgi:hypothetical protein